MSGAFVKEEDAQWLHDVQPTVSALIDYLTRDNNGVRVYEIRRYFHQKDGREIVSMSNGMDYTKDAEGRWEIVW
jgi:hypothetical protein